MARSRIDIAGDALEHQSDADLAVRAANGDREAFEELYRRHSRTAMRVAYRVTGNIHDASDAVSDAFARVMQALPQGRLVEPTRFRSYLLTSTRHAAVDQMRRAGKAVPSDDAAEPAETAAGPSELLIDRADNALVATAFRGLPERWRSVLWLTEVEGIPAREAAGMLGVSANGVAQLAVRARAGLRERYLQAHLPEVDGDCKDTVRRLGAYVGGALAPRDVARVDQHLADCENCRGRQHDLEEIGTTLRKAVAPLPLAVSGVGGLTGLAAKLTDVADRVTRAVGSLTQTASGVPAAAAGVAAAAVFVASIAGVGVVRDRNQPPAQALRPQADKVVRDTAAAPVASTPAADAPAAAVTAPAPTAAVAAKPAPAAKVTTAPSAVAPTAPAKTPGGSTSPAPTTPTTAPPAQHRDDTPPIVDLPDTPEVPGVDLPDTPELPGVPTVPEVPLPELPGVPTLPEVPLPGLPALGEVSPLDSVTAMGMASADAVLVAESLSTLLLWLGGIDEPLPSPEAPGAPV